MSMNCCISLCENEAQYKCPRCDACYCSVPCYRAHSEPCVQSFSQQASAQLAGIRASDAEKTRFNALLNRMRRDDDLQLFQDFEPSSSDSNRRAPDERQASSGVCGSDSEESEQPLRSLSKGENEPHVLEQLLNAMNDDEKETFFSMFNVLMERACGSRSVPPKDGSGKGSQGTLIGSSSTCNPAGSLNDSSGGFDCGEQQQETDSKREDIADTLEDLVQDMEELNLTYEQILSKLPRELADKFFDHLKEASFHETLKPWRPWWHVSRDDDGDDEEAIEPPPLPKAEELVVSPEVPKRAASPLLINCVIDVLNAICLSLRLYDGDCLSDAFHAAKAIWRLSPTLSADDRYTTVSQACRACIEVVSKCYGREVALTTLEDAACVLGGCSDWVTRCLFYGQTVLREGRKVVRVQGGRRAIKGGTKKIGFMVAWALCQESFVFTHAARSVGSFVEMERGRCEELRVAKRVVRLVSIEK